METTTLTGTEKQIVWATEIRNVFMLHADVAMVYATRSANNERQQMTDADYAEMSERDRRSYGWDLYRPNLYTAAIERIMATTDAGWWIDKMKGIQAPIKGFGPHSLIVSTANAIQDEMMKSNLDAPSV